MFSHYATRKISLICKISTFSEDLSFLNLGSHLKVSEYPFKQNKNMLKNMIVLLYTNFYNISLNVIRPTFSNIYNLPFLRSPNIGKIRVKVGPKLTTFPIFRPPAPTELQFLIIFFHWYVVNQEINKSVPAIFLFPNIF